jgi:hypothetical protein
LEKQIIPKCEEETNHHNKYFGKGLHFRTAFWCATADTLAYICISPTEKSLKSENDKVIELHLDSAKTTIESGIKHDHDCTLRELMPNAAVINGVLFPRFVLCRVVLSCLVLKSFRRINSIVSLNLVFCICSSKTDLKWKNRSPLLSSATPPNMTLEFRQRYCHGIKREIKHTKPIQRHDYLLAPSDMLHLKQKHPGILDEKERGLAVFQHL